MTDLTPPREDLYRAMPGGVTSADGRTLTVRLAPADQWAEIQSQTEGHFMERFSRSAYRKTMAENLPKILFQHGKDPVIGEKPIATTDTVGEDDISPYARGQILDGLPELVLDGLRKGVYGASHRFNVVREDWVQVPKGGPHNPDRLPERTITEARLYELGPVTWPAYSSASVSLRSITDEMRTPMPDPVAPSLDAEAEAPHLEPERRDEPVTIAAPTPKEAHKVPDIHRVDRPARISELRALADGFANDHEGALSAELQADWDTMTAELRQLEADQRADEERRAFVANHATREAAVERIGQESPRYSAPNVRRQRVDNIYSLGEIRTASNGADDERQLQRDCAMRAVEATSWANPNTDVPKTQSKIARLLDHADTADKEFARRVLATGDPAYVRAFTKLVASGGNVAVLTPEEMRGTAITIGGTGQYLVPFAFDPTVIAIGAHNANPYRANCRVVEVVGASIWHALTSTAAVAVRGVENLVAAEQGPTFAQPSFTPSTVKAQITYSGEAAQDRPDLASELAVLIQEAKDNEEEATYSVGTGATTMLNVVGMAPPTGTSGAFTAKTTITGGGATVAIADLYALEMDVPMRWRADAAWFMARNTIRKFQGFETTGGILFNAIQQFGGGAAYPAVGNPVNSPLGQTGLRLLGYPVFEAPSIPIATGANAPICTLAAKNQFVLVDRVGMEVQFIPWIQTAGTIYVAGQQALFAMWRNAGGPMQADAGRVLRYLT